MHGVLKIKMHRTVNFRRGFRLFFVLGLCVVQFVGSSERRRKTARVTRYYLEDGKYEENANFESWADKLRRMWEKVIHSPEYFSQITS